MNKKITTAKIDTNRTSDKIIVNIFGYEYIYKGKSLANSLYDSISDHIENDREFSEFLNVFSQDGQEDIYSAALLCGFGFIDKETLAGLLLPSILKKDDNGTSH